VIWHMRRCVHTRARVPCNATPHAFLAAAQVAMQHSKDSQALARRKRRQVGPKDDITQVRLSGLFACLSRNRRARACGSTANFYKRIGCCSACHTNRLNSACVRIH
jgi:hypothetical protein